MRASWAGLLALGCAGEPVVELDYTEEREACALRVPERRVLWGDLHVHGAFSFDARNYQSMLQPAEVLAFARGVPQRIAPVDGEGMGTREVRLDRPLDFAAATEHGEFLGEIAHCTTPGSPGYESGICAPYRPEGGDSGAFDFGVLLATDTPKRNSTLCGEDGLGCVDAAKERWAQIQQATEDAYDRTESCVFTSFVAYEYTNATGVSNLHRNVVFRTAKVPELPVSHFEAPTPEALWRGIQSACADGACDALLIPHNANLSNGRLYETSKLDDPDLATLRGGLEPVIEMFQHKGNGECRNGFGAPEDPDCDFEQQRPPGDEVCGEAPGSGGMRLWGCTHRLEFAREVLKEGLRLGKRTGVNPYRLGFLAATDTHNGTAGLVRSHDYPGHIGIVDADVEDRLGEGNLTHDAYLNNPGGLAGVWAVENSRDAIFEAIRRREVFATSGPRIQVRLFGGDLPSDLCDREDGVVVADRVGAAMGGSLQPGVAKARFFVQAIADEGGELQAGVGLARIQIVKGWLEGDRLMERVVDVVEAADAGDVDGATCQAEGGAASLCAVWEDPDHDPAVPAFWYARVLEVPTCRWSTPLCSSFAPGDRPPLCDETWLAPVVRQRAWSSPIWSGGAP